MPQKKIPPRVSEKLKYYVYLYADPRTKRPFYVGKGHGNRIYQGLDDKEDCEKTKRIAELHKLGLEPTLEILKYGLTEKEAFLVESAAIDLIGPDETTNRVRGHGARNGRAGLVEVIQELDAAEVTITEKVILVNIRQLFRYGMSALELYDATRSRWKVKRSHCDKAEFAFCVYKGVVREVYSIAAWVPDGSTMSSRNYSESLPTRLDFVGTIASEQMRKKYIGKSVRLYLAQYPIRYVNC